jgi:hypothetical protein
MGIAAQQNVETKKIRARRCAGARTATRAVDAASFGPPGAQHNDSFQHR